jgi:hypothetical protein
MVVTIDGGTVGSKNPSTLEVRVGVKVRELQYRLQGDFTNKRWASPYR